MKKVLFSLIVLISTLSLSSQNLGDISFGSDDTFDLITWNIEWFPKNGQTTIDSVSRIIEALDVDVLALQEIDDTVLFRQMVDSIDGYECHFESSWFAGLAYIYKSETVIINDIYEIYTTQPYWSPFPRSPMVMELEFMNKEIIIINNHFKCCGDGIMNLNDSGDEETRRFEASNLLKEYIDVNFSDKRVLMLGDLNDLLTDNESNNVFQSYLNDSTNYLFADMEIANGPGSGWSFPGWPSHLDHILMTNEIFDEFEEESSEIKVIKIDSYLSGGMSAYDYYISDHRPVALKLKLFPYSIDDNESNTVSQQLVIYPNPSYNQTTIMFNTLLSNAILEIYSVSGQLIQHNKISPNQKSVTINTSLIPNGVYNISLKEDDKILDTSRLIIVK